MALTPRVGGSGRDRFAARGVTWFAYAGCPHEQYSRCTRRPARLQALDASATAAGEALFARNIRVLRLEVEAWIAHAERRTAASLALMREAAELEHATPKHAVTPGPTLPANEVWGDLLADQGNHKEALAMYRRSLELYPRRFNSLLGAARSAVASDDKVSARAYYQWLLDVAGNGTRRAEIDEARVFVAANR